MLHCLREIKLKSHSIRHNGVYNRCKSSVILMRSSTAISQKRKENVDEKRWIEPPMGSLCISAVFRYLNLILFAPFPFFCSESFSESSSPRCRYQWNSSFNNVSIESRWHAYSIGTFRPNAFHQFSFRSRRPIKMPAAHIQVGTVSPRDRVNVYGAHIGRFDAPNSFEKGE